MLIIIFMRNTHCSKYLRLLFGSHVQPGPANNVGPGCFAALNGQAGALFWTAFGRRCRHVYSVFTDWLSWWWNYPTHINRCWHFGWYCTKVAYLVWNHEASFQQTGDLKASAVENQFKKGLILQLCKSQKSLVAIGAIVTVAIPRFHIEGVSNCIMVFGSGDQWRVVHRVCNLLRARIKKSRQWILPWWRWVNQSCVCCIFFVAYRFVFARKGNLRDREKRECSICAFV